jgi:hypothetical protein
MKLRIKDNSIRLRLTQSEVEHFQSEGAVEGKTDFGIGSEPLTYRLESVDTTSLGAVFNSGCITVRIPKAMAQKWVETDLVGLSNDVHRDQPYLLIEKDFACLTVREGEDESDAFPNPNESC